MSELSDLQIHINGQHTFFLSERILSKYSGKFRKIIKQQKRRTQIRHSGIELDGFPGGPHGFELVSRFCYNNGCISITVANVPLLHCCAVYLGMTEKSSRTNLLQQTELFLEGIFYWSWHEVITCLKNCEPFFSYADSCGLIQKLVCSLLAKIAQNSDSNFLSTTPSSSSSSPEIMSRSLSLSSSTNKSWAWWFQDLTILSPKTIEQFFRALGAYGSENSNLVLTRFLLHYLKTSLQSSSSKNFPNEYVGLADTAVHGVVLMGKTAVFSCRRLLWVLRIVSGFGVSRESRYALERLIGTMLDQATLDDLLVSGNGGGGGGVLVYDVSLVLRLIRIFVHYCNDDDDDDDDDEKSLHKLKKVGVLVDMYLGEIGPDPHLKISKFVGVAESLPDCARDSFDHVYRAVDIYLQSHPFLSLEERSRLCRGLNYEKLSLETCKDLAKNPRIPPRIAVQALASQHSHLQITESLDDYDGGIDTKSSSNRYTNNHQMVLYKSKDEEAFVKSSEDKEVQVSLERMRWRVVELENVCREMKGQMARMVKITAPQSSRSLPRMC